jgi:fatty acid desaturase
LFFIGSRFRAIGNMMHECAHHTFLPGRQWNGVFGHFFSFFDFTDYTDYRLEHLSHHRNLGHYDTDLDFKPRRALFESLGPMSLRYIGFAIALRHVPSYVRPVVVSRTDPPRLAMARAIFNLGLIACATFVTGWPAFLLYYIVPYLTTYQILRFLSDAVDHAGIMSNAEEFYRSRNHVSRWACVNWLLFPRHDEYHLVHHLFPWAPLECMRSVHRLLLQNARYGARDHALRPLLRASRVP